MTTGVAEIKQGIDREYVDDALRLLYDAFAKKFRIGFRNADDFALLFRDAADTASCLSVVADGQCMGILTFQAADRDFYHLRLWTLFTRFSPVRALRMLVNSLLMYEGVKKDEFFVASLAVSPSARGLGLGTRLMGKAEETARGMGKGTMALSVIDENEGAIRLYERLGYRTTRNRTGFLIRLVAQSNGVKRMEKPLHHEREPDKSRAG